MLQKSEFFNPIDKSEQDSEFIAMEPRSFWHDVWDRFRSNRRALIGFIVLTQVGVLGGDPNVSAVKGLLYLAACLPMAIVGLISAKWQTKASIASISLLAKKPDQFGKAMTLPVMVETYAVLALLISILSIFGIGGLPV